MNRREGPGVIQFQVDMPNVEGFIVADLVAYLLGEKGTTVGSVLGDRQKLTGHLSTALYPLLSDDGPEETLP